jgi:hypothetical protein
MMVCVEMINNGKFVMISFIVVALCYAVLFSWASMVAAMTLSTEADKIVIFSVWK